MTYYACKVQQLPPKIHFFIEQEPIYIIYALNAQCIRLIYLTIYLRTVRLYKCIKKNHDSVLASIFYVRQAIRCLHSTLQSYYYFVTLIVCINLSVCFRSFRKLFKYLTFQTVCSIYLNDYLYLRNHLS